jgi:hypothetical protein
LRAPASIEISACSCFHVRRAAEPQGLLSVVFDGRRLRKADIFALCSSVGVVAYPSGPLTAFATAAFAAAQKPRRIRAALRLVNTAGRPDDASVDVLVNLLAERQGRTSLAPHHRRTFSVASTIPAISHHSHARVAIRIRRLREPARSQPMLLRRA